MAECNNFSDKIQKCIGDAASQFFDDSLQVKDSQASCIKSIIYGKNTMGVLPTGFGKTLIYQLLPHVGMKLRSTGYEFPANPIVLIVSPLTALIQEQVERCERFGKATQLTEKLSEDVKNGKIRYLFSSPEMFTPELCRELFSSKVYQENVIAIVVDEAHIVVKWGTSADPSKKPFREAYSELGKLRCFFNKPFLCLTATANNKTKFGIQKILLLKQFDTIEVSPDKLNAKLILEDIGYELEPVFETMSNILKRETKDFDKVIIYCRSIDKAKEIRKHFAETFGDFDDPLPFAMYHAKLSRKRREAVMEEFVKVNGSIRLVIGTCAIGMGINIPDIRSIVFYGVPSDMESFVQGMGRAGRDGKECECVLLVRPCDHALAKEDKYLKNYISNKTECRRKIMLLTFSHHPLSREIMHECCDICQQNCCCATCQLPLPTNSTPKIERNQMLKKRDVSPALRANFKELLLACNDMNESDCTFSIDKVTSTISLQVINEICEKCDYIFDLKFVKDNFELFDDETQLIVLGVIHDVFQDFDIPDSYLEQGPEVYTHIKPFHEMIDFNAEVQKLVSDDEFNDDWLFEL